MTQEHKNECMHNYELPPAIRQFADRKYFGERKLQVFNADWDAEGVYFYQAYCDEIADHAVTKQRFGGKRWNPTRMTWIKPSFGWMLYRCGYAKKPGQERVLRMKLPHHAVAHILDHCKLTQLGGNDGGSPGRVQWDPERDLYSPTSKGKLEPRKIPRIRAIQIGLRGTLSEYYVDNLLSVEDVTDLAQQIYNQHALMRSNNLMEREQGEAEIRELEMTSEKPYLSSCDKEALMRLGMLPGEPATNLARIFYQTKLPK